MGRTERKEKRTALKRKLKKQGVSDAQLEGKSVRELTAMAGKPPHLHRRSSRPIDPVRLIGTSKVRLHYQDEKSDKIYEMSLRPVGKKWAVDYRFGRRGTSLRSGTKTKRPVSLRAAEKILMDLLQKKLAKGYLVVSS